MHGDVISLNKVLRSNFKAKVQGEGVPKKYLAPLEHPTYENLMKFVSNYVDGVIYETPKPDPKLVECFEEKNIASLAFQDKSNPEYLDRYLEFYNKILANE